MQRSISGFSGYETVSEFRKGESERDKTLTRDRTYSVGDTIRVNRLADVHIHSLTPDTCELVVAGNRGLILDALGCSEVEDSNPEHGRVMHRRVLHADEGALLLGHSVLMDGIEQIDEETSVRLKWVFRRGVWSPDSDDAVCKNLPKDIAQWLEQRGNSRNAA